MRHKTGPEVTASDELLVERTRLGDQRAFAELWRRHYRSGARVARQFTSTVDADDLVSEAYTRIYQRVLAGGGPTGAFRPYLYTTIRNLASTWGAAAKHVQVDDITDFEDPTTLDDPAAIALDKTLTARAFRNLPERWQSVLWYTEVEGMDPHEVAPMLGMTANGVAALSYRAREGLRKAWLQAHINDDATTGECQWSLSRVGEHARRGLSARDTERMNFHLATCARCAIVNEEVDEVGSRLALVMLPILLGGVAGGTFLASFGEAATASAAVSDVIPALPEAITAGSAAAVGVAGLVGAAATPTAIVGTLAIAVAMTGSVAVLAPSASGDTSSSTSQSEEGASGSTDNDTLGDSDDALLPPPQATSPDNIPGTDGLVDEVVDDVDGILGGVVGGTDGVVGGVLGDVGGIVGGVLDSVTGDDGLVAATISLNLSGTGTPGAAVSLQAGGLVYANTTVDASGHFTLTANAIPGGLKSLELVQVVDRSYLAQLAGVSGLLGGLFGTLDQVINSLIQPLGLSSGTIPGVNITLLS